MIDYIIVGLGLAGMSFCEMLQQNNKTFIVVDDGLQQASQVAAGLYNPVILKRFTPAWKADQQMAMVASFYASFERRLGVTVDEKIPILRRFASVEEQNLWFEAADRPVLSNYLGAEVLSNQNQYIDAPFGYGEVRHTGRMTTKKLLLAYRDDVQRQNRLRKTAFNYEELNTVNDCVEYGDIKARHIVFADGFGLKSNPYFNYLPLNGTKGELLTILAPELKEDHIIKASVFIVPLGKDLYKVGATYKWKDKTDTPTVDAKNELLRKLEIFLKCNYKVVDHIAGIRPTVADRRPLVGRHPKYKNVYALNGLGSRGVMIAPYASLQLFDFIEKGAPLDAEMNIQRFAKKWDNRQD